MFVHRTIIKQNLLSRNQNARTDRAIAIVKLPKLDERLIRAKDYSSFKVGQSAVPDERSYGFFARMHERLIEANHASINQLTIYSQNNEHYSYCFNPWSSKNRKRCSSRIQFQQNFQSCRQFVGQTNVERLQTQRRNSWLCGVAEQHFE